MRNTIINFAKQFAYKPVIENEGGLKKRKRLIVIGMGGSHLAGDILAAIKPSLGIIVHKNYGIPEISEEDLDDSLIIFSSYSGNTEEVLDAYNMAKERNLAMAVISIGGKLLEWAKKDGVPFVQMPDTGIAPRFALGFSFLALLKIAGEDETLLDAEKLAAELVPESWEEPGKRMAKNLAGKVPLIYASLKNQTLAYNWKIRLNETGCVPAFCNVLPELNHNELDGFDAREATRGLSELFYFIFLRDPDDDPRIIKRMEAMKTILEEKNLPTEMLRLENGSALYKIFASVILADWATYYLAEDYGIAKDDLHLVEKFKKLIGQ
ncbi:MAG: SIS domain-containing protein [Patescibacteria group bacterium]